MYICASVTEHQQKVLLIYIFYVLLIYVIFVNNILYIFLSIYLNISFFYCFFSMLVWL